MLPTNQIDPAGFRSPSVNLLIIDWSLHGKRFPGRGVETLTIEAGRKTVLVEELFGRVADAYVQATG
jgi:hypothetical protein